MDSPSEDVFLQHAGALRRLAVRLSGCPQRADDAVQETWVAALREPKPKNVWGWLEAVLRNVVRRQGRDDTRRRARESTRAQGDAAEVGPVDVLARQQTLREVTEAVAALPVPLQECVFLRYFEDLPPRAIAQRLGLPVATVYKRLDRARGLLRARLRSRRGALAALFGFPTFSLWQLAAATTVLLVNGKKTIVAVTAILALASVWAFIWFDPGLGNAPGGPDRPRAATASLEGGAVVDSRGPAREAAEDEVEDEAGTAADLPYEFSLDVEVIGDADLPVGRTAIRLAPEGLPFNYTNTDDDGVARIKWRGRQSSAHMIVACPGRGQPLRLHRVTLAAGESGYLRVRGGSNRSSASQIMIRYRLDSSITWGRLPTTPVSELRVDEDGYAQFQLPLSGVPKSADLAGSYAAIANFGQVVLEPTSGLISFDDTTAGSPGASDLHVVSGVVRDASGKLAKKAYVTIGDSADREGRWSTRTDDQGRFKLDDVRGGSWVLRVGGGELGLHQQKIELANGTPLELETRLDRGLEFHGELLDADGNALAGWEVEVRDPTGRDFLDYTTTQGDGTFSIPNVDDRPLVVTVFGPDSELPSHRFDARYPGRRVVLPVPTHRARFGSLEFDLRRADGSEWGGLQVMLWDEVSGRGVLREMGQSVSRLPAGSYRVQVQGPGLGVLDRGVATVRADAENATGPHFLPALVSVEPDWAAEAPKDMVFEHPLVDAQVTGVGNEPFLGWPGMFRHGGLAEPVELVPGHQRMK